MRVLLINNRFETRGGADIVFIEQGNELKKLGHQIARLFVDTKETLESRTELEFKVATFFNQRDRIMKKLLKLPLFFFNPFAFLKALQAISVFRPDVIHYHLYKGELTWAVVLAGKLIGTKLVLTSHDYGLVDPHNLLLDGNRKISTSTLQRPSSAIIEKSNRNSLILSLFSYLEYKIERLFIRPGKVFDKIICVSRFQKGIYRKSWLNLHANIEIISNYSRLEKLDVHQTREDFYLYVGRISPEKGIHELVESFKTLPDLKLLVVGGNRPQSIERLANVDWLGKIDGLRLVKLVSGARFLVVPSICHENNSLSILEALSLGTPVIASSYGGSPEMVKDMETGLLFDFEGKANLTDALKRSVGINDLDYQRLCSYCLKHYRSSYSKEGHYKKLHNLYERLYL